MLVPVPEGSEWGAVSESPETQQPKDIHMADSIVSLAEPFFLKSLAIVGDRKNDHSGDLARLQAELSKELQAIEQKVHSGELKVSPAEWASLKEALIYWVDEILTHHFPAWQNYVLEHEYFKQRNRAWKFYVEGDKYLVTGSEDTAEVFYLAIVLGFVGDISGAFNVVMKKNLPGEAKTPEDARVFWARQLQARLRQHQTKELQEKKLQGDAAPLESTRTLKLAAATFTISVLCLLVTLSWYLFRNQ